MNSGINKRGEFGIGIFYLVVVLFVLGLLFVLTYKPFTELNDDIQADVNLPNESKVLLQDDVDRYPSTFDSAFGLILFFLWLAILIGAYYVDESPFILIVGIVLLVIIIIIAGFLNNAYAETVSQDEFSSYIDSFPITNFVFNNLIIFVLVMMITVFVTMFIKNRFA